MFNHFLRSRASLNLSVRSYATELHNASLKPSIYGQPLFASHPHLIKPEELTPGIKAQEYEDRRRNLMDRLPDNSVVVSLAGAVKYMSGKIFYKFRQASDFWYLTGFEEPDSALILEKNHSTRGYHMTLFSSGSDSNKEQWDGASTTFGDARKIFQADDARHIDDFPSHLRSVIPQYSNVYFDLPPSRTRRPMKTTKSLLKFLNGGSESDLVLDTLGKARPKPLSSEIGRLRAFKSPSEQKLMRAAADISGRAHAKTMRFTRPGLSEAALAAHFNYLCRLSGAQRLAYVPVVASGPNALIIHYTHNNQLINQDELILMDAACEYNGYASDITRTYPANGSFTPPQRDLYSAVLSAQKTLVSLCHEGSSMNLYELHRKSSELLRQELLQIGFQLHGGDLERLYPHFVSHPIGIDLHESDNFTRSGSLKAGMVVTVEPGIYVPPSPAFPKYFHNLGVRIEDEVLVGKENPVVLSVNAPKEIADVEGACQGLLDLEPF
ncbi:peptidase M24 [Lentinula raphanica]|nr:peptidase M24 [Lentinula raphanica]